MSQEPSSDSRTTGRPGWARWWIIVVVMAAVIGTPLVLAAYTLLHV
jgi:hypothetical protein